MKGYTREHPEFSLCGLNCRLCPMHLGGYCPGCGGGEGHQSCSLIRCSLEHGGVEFCFQCDQFPCGRCEKAMEFDSFLPHRNMIRDQERARNMGIETYLVQQGEKAEVLRFLLENYNDGRKKSLFCTAVNLLEAEDLIRLRKRLELETPVELPGKERAALAAMLLQREGERRNISLKLKKPKDNPERGRTS